MRFREFSDKRVKEGIPAVIAKDLKAVGPAVLQATKNLAGQLTNKISAAAGKKTTAAPQNTPAIPGMQAQLQPQASAVQQAQLQATQAATKPPPIPAVGSQLVLPDKVIIPVLVNVVLLAIEFVPPRKETL